MDSITPARKRTVAARLPGPRSYNHSSTTRQGTTALANGSGTRWNPGGIVDRRAVGILQKRLPAVVADRQPRVPGFNDAAIATQRFQVREQAPGKTPATRQMRTRDFTFATFAPSCCETKYLSTDLTHSAYCSSTKSRLGELFSSLESA